MSFRDDSVADIFLTHTGGTMGFYLYEDPQAPNFRQWAPTFLPENSQQIQQGPMTYDDRPKFISQPLVFETFAEGAGFNEAPQGTTAPTGYSYSRGIDASWPGGICLSPQAQVSSGNIAEAVTKFYRSPTYGYFALTATHIYKLTAGVWVQCAVNPGAAPTDIIEYGNSTATYLFLALGDSTNLIYSTDSFATSTSYVKKFSFFSIRGNTSVEPVLFGTTAAGMTATSTNPIAAANWTNTDLIGSAGQVVTSTLVANDLVYYLKQEGIYAFDGTSVAQLVSTDLLKRSNNGSQSFVWVNGYIYANYGNRVLRINPFTNETQRLWAPTHPELNGTVTAITADLRYMYIAVQNADGNTYIIKLDMSGAEESIAKNETIAWHTIAYLPAQTCSAMTIVAAGVGGAHASNNVLVVGTGTTVVSYILPRDGYRPWEDGNCLFDIAGGTLYSPWIDAGVMVYDKWLNGGRVTTSLSSGVQNTALAYQIDHIDVTAATLVNGVEDGTTTGVVATEITFGNIRAVITQGTGDNRHTPRCLGAVIDCTPNSPRHRSWGLLLDLGDQQRPRTGGDKRPVAFKRMLNHLYSSVGKRCTMTDYFGDEYIVKVLNVTLRGVKRNTTGQGRAQATAIAEVSVAEIIQNTTQDDPFIWGDAAGAGGTPWNAGYEWSA